MPEIAEVETVRRTLTKKIINKKIVDVKILYPKMIISNIDSFMKIKDQRFVEIKRIGKWLIFELNDYYLLSHLRMEGKYFIKDSNVPIEKHEHIIFTLNDATDLRYHDVRKFGRMLLINKNELYTIEQIKKQGIEANDSKLSVDYLMNKLIKKELPIKTCLLDQTIISGLGNIYADEVLFRSKVYPLTKGKNISSNQAKNIIESSTNIINKAIEMGGTTIKSFTSSLGVTGQYQQELKVHKRENALCYICNTKIIKIKVGGRGTYYCPKCQKED